MWLLNTKTFKLEEFYSDVPSYAILSHRWRKDEEVSFGGLEEPHPHSDRSGFKKIMDFCKKARKRRFAYVWVDTCCIDKKSSAELSEAINSMYAYYSRAKICYVHLHDVTTLDDFDHSSWFTRGWTLQELLAPSKLHFFNNKWKPMGSKTRLASKIKNVTGIPEKALNDLNLTQYCIADRLSWSARRRTTREEDRAYCLLGLFQINMPLLYGEGTRAFQRLQEEIMKTSTDTSIFLWQGPAVEAFGMLASDPSCFSRTPDTVQSFPRDTILSTNQGWTLDNSGISLPARIYPYLLTKDFESIYAIPLGHHDPLGLWHVIFVKKLYNVLGLTHFARVTVNRVGWCGLREFPESEPSFDFRLKNEKFSIVRQPIEDIQLLADESRGIVASLTASAAISCAAYQLPSRDHKLRWWKEPQGKRSKSFDISFSVDPRDATGMHGYVLLTLMEDVEIMIWLGLSRRYHPLCIVIPFCKQILDDGIWASRVSWAHDDITQGKEDEYGSYEIFDTEIHMLCLCGVDSGLETDTAIGLSFGILKESTRPGMLDGSIDFDVEEFIEHYTSEADPSAHGSPNDAPRDIRSILLDAELAINANRRARRFL